MRSDFEADFKPYFLKEVYKDDALLISKVVGKADVCITVCKLKMTHM